MEGQAAGGQSVGQGRIIHKAIPFQLYNSYEVSIHTDIGGRKYQEDRFTFCPQLITGRNDCSFFGVFDGTVGDFASDTVKELIIPQLWNSPAWMKLENELSSAGMDMSRVDGNVIKGLLEAATVNMYQQSDKQLLAKCAENRKDYASTTAVTAILVGKYLGIGHLGDSRVAMGTKRDGELMGQFLTTDHKPDQPHERERIIQSGGSVEYLHNHNNKPFIRGGDFTVRKQRGEQPMQLQYSRAFGGKDLKTFGLSNHPDFTFKEVTPNDICMILASDGLWDVLSAAHAVTLACKARSEGRNPAQSLIRTTLLEQQQRNQGADNITATVVFFHPATLSPSSEFVANSVATSVEAPMPRLHK